MNQPYIAPQYELTAFNCLHCNAYAEQYWSDILYDPEDLNERFCNLIEILENGSIDQYNYHTYLSKQLEDWSSDINNCLVPNTKVTTCNHCKKQSFWINEKLIYPSNATAPMPNPDMPNDVKELYMEARMVSNLSPRSAATLLRVAIEKITEHLGETTGSLHSRIGRLNKQGLPEEVIKGLNIVRIFGNDGAHSSNEIDTTGQDNQNVVDKLFWLINFIVEKVITDGKQIEQMYNNLPDTKK